VLTAPHEGAVGDIEILPPSAPSALVSVGLSASDHQLIELWLNGRPASTAAAYRSDISGLVAHGCASLASITLQQLQEWVATLGELKPASRRRKVAAVKSLFAFGHRTGHLVVDVAAPLLMPSVRDALSERIMAEAEVQRMLQLEPNARNNALLRLVYAAGLRVSEVCDLKWRDLKGTKGGGVASVFGKGGKTRSVIIQPKLWRTLSALRAGAGPDDPVFRSERGGALDRSAVGRLVKAAAARAGLSAEISTHWLRHAHASHSLDHGAPLHVLRESLGHASLATTSRYVHVRPEDGSAKYLPE
jgi:integrase/recombinase XerD